MIKQDVKINGITYSVRAVSNEILKESIKDLKKLHKKKKEVV